MKRLERTATITAWGLILVVTAVDVGCAIMFGSCLDEWELNPVACLLWQCWGVWACVALRLITVAYGLIVVSIATVRARRIGTLTILLPHLYLAGAYLCLVTIQG